MEYYDTLVKTYSQNNKESIRFIKYEDALARPTTPLESEELRVARLNYHTEHAEICEPVKNLPPRNYKEESIARAKRVVKDIIRNNYSDNLKMLTLTYSKIVIDKGKVLSDIKNMCKRYKIACGKDLKYIASLEWQESRHCIHVHMIIDCKYMPAEVWSNSIWLQGFIKINTISHGKSKSDCLNSIDYCLKYIGKDFESCDYYKHLYFRSRNWNTRIKKEYMVTKDKEECISRARRYFQADDYDIRVFEYNVYADKWITIIDVYPVFIV